MASQARIERKRREIEVLAEGWGKLLAREAFANGVELDADPYAMEEIAVTAARSLVRGAVQLPRKTPRFRVFFAFLEPWLRLFEG